jgi:hypothetical protein
MILTKDPITKGSPATFTLDKAALALVTSVANSTYYADTANWKAVVVVYKSSTGNQSKKVTFDVSGAGPYTAPFYASIQSRNVFDVSKILILDYDGGNFPVYSSELTVGEFDIDMGVIVPTFSWDLITGNAASTGGTELHNTVWDFSWANMGRYDTLVTGDFVWTVQHEITGAGPDDMMAGYKKTLPFAGTPEDALESGIYGHSSFTRSIGYGGTDVAVQGNVAFNGGINVIEISRVGSAITLKANGVTMSTDTYSDGLYLVAIFAGTDSRIISAVLS